MVIRALQWCWLAVLTCCLGCTAQVASAISSQPVPSWFTPLILLVSVSISLVSLRLALLASRAETFRNLRVAFNKLRDDLPDRFWLETRMPAEPRHFDAMVKYWQFAFDEWFITQRLNPKVFGKLWRAYYSEVITVSCKSPTMVAALFQAAVGACGEADRAFLDLVLNEPYTSPEVLAQAKALAIAVGIPVPEGR